MVFSKAIICPVTLQGCNYPLWSRLMKTALVGKELWNHCISDGPNISKAAAFEADDEKASSRLAIDEAWKQEDLLVLSSLELNLESSIREAHSYCESAKELWNTLKMIYESRCDLYRVFELKKAINELSQEESEFIEHLRKFRSLTTELERLRPQSIDPEVQNERREQDRVIDLLLTLKPVYNNLIMHILKSDELPLLEQVCAQVQKEECSLGLCETKETLSFAVHTGGSSHKGKAIQKEENRKIMKCDHCKKGGHLKESCWMLNPKLKPAKFK